MASRVLALILKTIGDQASVVLFWVLIAAISFVTLAVLVLPVTRASNENTVSGDSRLVYEDQLADLDRDVARGVVSDEEADALKAEIARRLIAADQSNLSEDQNDLSANQKKSAIGIVAILVVVASAAVYAGLGNPGMPGVPASERAAEREYVQNIEKLAALMKQNPEDATGWRLLAIGYRAMGRMEEAANAYEQAVTRGSQEAEVLADYGELLVLLNRGTVTPRAQEVFAAALKQAPTDERSQYYQALALMQAEQFDEARAAFMALQQSAPEDASWRQNVERRLKEIDVLQQQAESATPGSVQDNPQILAMVQGLAARLETEPDDLEGWLRLMRSYVVLDAIDLAEEAHRSALGTFENNEPALSQIRSLADELGLPPVN